MGPYIVRVEIENKTTLFLISSKEYRMCKLIILLQTDDLFKVSIDGDLIEGPSPAKKLKQSQCTPLFMNAYRMRGELLTHHYAIIMVIFGRAHNVIPVLK